MKLNGFTLTLALGSVVSTTAFAQGYDELGGYNRTNHDSEQYAAIEARFGPYVPNVDEDVNGAPDSNHRTPTEWANTLLGLTWAANDELRTAVGDGPLITDDRPLPEYFILRRLANPDAERLTLGGLRELLP